MANELSRQKYTNNIRTVSGTPTIYKDDVTLNCTTSSAAVTINLLEIPSNYWMTTWELLIVDASNNAATNNITITAPTGFKINGAQSITISSNGGSALVKIVNNTNFIATLSSTGSGTVTGGTNIGTGQGQSYAGLSGSTMQFKTIKQGSNITVTNNTNDITIDASSASSYVYATKPLQAAGTFYSTVAAGTRSVLSGVVAGAFGSKVESGITGFDLSTGFWTVATTDYYDVCAKMVTRINSTTIDSNTNDAGTGYWVTLAPIDGGEGFISIAIIIYRNSGGGLTPIVVTGEKQFVSQNVSDVNIECSAIKYPFVAGDLVKVMILNKTNNNIIGMASLAGTPDCYVDFSASK